ncbi:MAG: DUF2442 domain-containing protein [Phycisphaerales bacterium]
MNGVGSSATHEHVATALRVSFRGQRIVLDLADGRQVRTPLALYPTLQAASPARRRRWALMDQGRGVEWFDLDLQLPVAAIIAGRPEIVPDPTWRDGVAARLARFRAAQPPKRTVA